MAALAYSSEKNMASASVTPSRFSISAHLTRIAFATAAISVEVGSAIVHFPLPCDVSARLRAFDFDPTGGAAISPCQPNGHNLGSDVPKLVLLRVVREIDPGEFWVSHGVLSKSSFGWIGCLSTRGRERHDH